MSSGVSIIICCFNSAGRLLPTLTHIAKQKVANSIPWEVILIDNASTDTTAETANEIWNNFNSNIPFQIINEQKQGLIYARQRGFTEAKYEFISFIDDDNWIEEKWIEKVYEIFNGDEKIGACGGSSEAVFESFIPDWFSKYEKNFAVGRQAEESGYIENKVGFLWGAGLSFRKSLWFRLKTKDFKNLTIGREGKKITAGEDTELCYAIRLLDYQLYYKEDLFLKHFISTDRLSFSYLEKMVVGFGKSNVRLNCYRVLLNPESFRIKSWGYEFFAAVKSIMKQSIQLPFIFDKMKRREIRVNRAYWKGYAIQTWKDKSEIQKNISTLSAFFLS
jgi:glycosyltransferase involved in cell wall biosynthesis